MKKRRRQPDREKGVDNGAPLGFASEEVPGSHERSVARGTGSGSEGFGSVFLSLEVSACAREAVASESRCSKILEGAKWRESNFEFKSPRSFSKWMNGRSTDRRGLGS